VFELLKNALGQLVALHHQLDGAAAILQSNKCDFAHHALGHHAAGDTKLFLDLGQLLTFHCTETVVQGSRRGIFTEIVRICLSRLA